MRLFLAENPILEKKKKNFILEKKIIHDIIFHESTESFVENYWYFLPNVIIPMFYRYSFYSMIN